MSALAELKYLNGTVYHPRVTARERWLIDNGAEVVALVEASVRHEVAVNAMCKAAKASQPDVVVAAAAESARRAKADIRASLEKLAGPTTPPHIDDFGATTA